MSKFWRCPLCERTYQSLGDQAFMACGNHPHPDALVLMEQVTPLQVEWNAEEERP